MLYGGMKCAAFVINAGRFFGIIFMKCVEYLSSNGPGVGWFLLSGIRRLNIAEEDAVTHIRLQSLSIRRMLIAEMEVCGHGDLDPETSVSREQGHKQFFTAELSMLKFILAIGLLALSLGSPAAAQTLDQQAWNEVTNRLAQSLRLEERTRCIFLHKQCMHCGTTRTAQTVS